MRWPRQVRVWSICSTRLSNCCCWCGSTASKAAIKPESEPTLAQIVALLQQNPTLKLFVVGHTDSTGSRELNMKLSAQRADAVAAQLIGQGVTGSRIATSGVGPDQPVASNATADGRAQNRRVEVTLRPLPGAQY